MLTQMAAIMFSTRKDPASVRDPPVHDAGYEPELAQSQEISTPSYTFDTGHAANTHSNQARKDKLRIQGKE